MDFLWAFVNCTKSQNYSSNSQTLANPRPATTTVCGFSKCDLCCFRNTILKTLLPLLVGSHLVSHENRNSHYKCEYFRFLSWSKWHKVLKWNTELLALFENVALNNFSSVVVLFAVNTRLYNPLLYFPMRLKYAHRSKVMQQHVTLTHAALQLFSPSFSIQCQPTLTDFYYFKPNI